MNILDKIINHFGSSAKLARAINVSGAVVCNWKQRGIPWEYFIPIEEASGGTITRYEILTAMHKEKQSKAA